MNKVFVIFLLLICFFLSFTINCIPHYRSAHPLNRGEIQVAYNAPFSGNARIGITNRLQYRVSIIYPDMLETDLCYSFGSDVYFAFAAGVSNYGTLGASITASKSFHKDHIIPYLGIGYNYVFSPQSVQLQENATTPYQYGQISLGSEVYIFKRHSRKYNLTLIPEINLWVDKNGIPVFADGLNSPMMTPWGSLGIAFSYDF